MTSDGEGPSIGLKPPPTIAQRFVEKFDKGTAPIWTWWSLRTKAVRVTTRYDFPDGSTIEHEECHDAEAEIRGYWPK